MKLTPRNAALLFCHCAEKNESL